MATRKKSNVALSTGGGSAEVEGKPVMAPSNEKRFSPDRIIAALSLIGLLTMAGCGIFDTRIEVAPIADVLADLPPEMRDTMLELSSPKMTAALRRAQASVGVVK